jgi:hypothetical protein
MRASECPRLEPDTDNVFYALAHDPDRLIVLERQTATIHTSAKWVGIGATAKSTSESKPGKSPVRLSSEGIRSECDPAIPHLLHAMPGDRQPLRAAGPGFVYCIDIAMRIASSGLTR